MKNVTLHLKKALFIDNFTSNETIYFYVNIYSLYKTETFLDVTISK